MGDGVIGGQRSHRAVVAVVEDMASMMAQAGACGDCPASPVTITDDSHSKTGVHPVPEGLWGWGNHQELEEERMVMRVLDHWPLTDGRCRIAARAPARSLPGPPACSAIDWALPVGHHLWPPTHCSITFALSTTRTLAAVCRGRRGQENQQNHHPKPSKEHTTMRRPTVLVPSNNLCIHGIHAQGTTDPKATASVRSPPENE